VSGKGLLSASLFKST